MLSSCTSESENGGFLQEHYRMRMTHMTKVRCLQSETRATFATLPLHLLSL